MERSDLREVLRADEPGLVLLIGAATLAMVLLAVAVVVQRPTVTIASAGAVALEGGRVTVVGAAVGRGSVLR